MGVMGSAWVARSGSDPRVRSDAQFAGRILRSGEGGGDGGGAAGAELRTACSTAEHGAETGITAKERSSFTSHTHTHTHTERFDWCSAVTGAPPLTS